MAKRPEQSLDVLGESLLAQQSARREKADKRRRKDERKLQVLGALVAGQSIVNSALQRRVTDIKENNTLNMLNAKLYHKKIQQAAQLYNTFEGHTVDDLNGAYVNDTFMTDFDTVYTPMFDRQMKLSYGDKQFSPSERNELYQDHKDELINNLITNRNDWKTGKTAFGLTNEQLALGSEADFNIQLTKLAKNATRNLPGSIFSGPNLKAIFSLGTRREGSIYDKSLADRSPLSGLKAAVTSLGLDKQFAESVTNFKNTSLDWIARADSEENKAVKDDMYLVLQDIGRRLKVGDPLLKSKALQPFAEDKLPDYKQKKEKIKGGVRMGEFFAWLEDPQNAPFKEQFQEASTAFYLKLRDQKGYQKEFLTNVLGLEVGSEPYREMERIFANDDELKIFANAFTIRTTVTDNSGSSRTILGEQGPLSRKEEFEIDTRPLRKLLKPKVEVSSEGFTVTEEFNDSKPEEQVDAIVDAGTDILKADIDDSSKNELVNTLVDQVPTPSITTKNELRERIVRGEEEPSYPLDLSGLPPEAGVFQVRSFMDRESLARLEKYAETGQKPKFPANVIENDLKRLGLPPDSTLDEIRTYVDSPVPISNQYVPQVERMKTLDIIPPNIDTSVVISKLDKLDNFTSYAESKDDNTRISSEGAEGFMQFFTNDPNQPGTQKSLQTAYNRLKKHIDAVEDSGMPVDLVQMAENGFVSLKNVSRESQGLLVLSNYIEDSAVDIRTGERLPSGTGSGYMTAYLEAAPGSLEEKQALQNLYYNVQHKTPKVGVGVAPELLEKIEINFERSYNKIFK